MYRFAVLLSAIILLPTISFCQCPTCTPDPTCVSTDGYPAICPAELPESTAGTYYESYLTFYLPAEINDPENGIEATLLEITITSVTGLPFGMTYSINDEDATYYPSQGDNLGCATLCGTPILPGVYNVNISVTALVEAFGFEVEQNQSFFYTFIVNPGSQGNTSFSFDNQAGCGSVTSGFEALLNLPSITTYYWDFGNGQTSTEEFPPDQTYDAPGDYTVTLTTTVSEYQLNSISISSLSDNWSGDVDDLFGDADVWFTISDGDGIVVYGSGIIDNNNAPQWNGIMLSLNNPPYTINFTDDDLISQDDFLGSANLSVQEGLAFFDTGIGTIGTAQVDLNVVNSLTDEEVISVFPIPDPTFIVTGNTLTYENPEVTGFIWYYNDVAIDNQFGPSLVMTEGGTYYAVVSNMYGCTAQSETFTFCPDLQVIWDELNEQLYVDDVYLSYQWYFNGLPIEGADEYYLTGPEPGNYWLEVTTDYGCTLESFVITIEVGISENQSSSGFTIFPNPAQGMIDISSNEPDIPVNVTVYDMNGRPCISQFYPVGTELRMNVFGLAPGIYIMEINKQRHRFIRK